MNTKSCPFCGVADRGGRLPRAAFCFNCGRRLNASPVASPSRVPQRSSRSCCSRGGVLLLLFAPLLAMFVMASSSRVCHPMRDSRWTQLHSDEARVQPYIRRINRFIAEGDFSRAQAEFRAAAETIQYRASEALERAQQHIWSAMRSANRRMQQRF